MLYDCLWFDLTELVTAPHRSGIQRVVIRILENLPRNAWLPFRVLDRRHVAILDPSLLEALKRYFESSSSSARAQAAVTQTGQTLPWSIEEFEIRTVGGRPMAVLTADRFYERAGAIINLEMFADFERAMFYVGCPDDHRGKIFHLIHDFLLFEHPELFPQLDWQHASNYVTVAEAWASAGTLITSTPDLRARAARYLGRAKSDIGVIEFGGDIGVVRDAAPRERRHVLVLGTIEPRKYPVEVAEALVEVAAEAVDTDITWVGGWGWVTPEQRRRIERSFARGGIAHRGNLPDAELKALIARSDVGLYVSSAEGFGLPVIEFAYAGVPTLTSATVPAGTLGIPGVTALAQVTPATVRDAVLDLLDRGAGEVSYDRTWASTAAQLVELVMARLGRKASSGLSTAVGRRWSLVMRAQREQIGEGESWETTKALVRDYLLTIPSAVAGAARKDGSPTNQAMLFGLTEQVSEAVSDNRDVIQPNELVGIRPLLGEMTAVVMADNATEFLRRAYRALLGREVDPRAAAEAPLYQEPRERYRRMTELRNSPESREHLGPRTSRILRRIFEDCDRVLALALEPRIDIFALMDALGLPEPSLETVYDVQALLTERTHPFEVLLYLSHGRRLTGDALDLLLEVLAERLKNAGYAITREVTVEPLVAVSDVRDFIRRSCRVILRKEVDDDGLRFYLGQIGSGAMTRADVVRQMVDSPEAARRGVRIV